MQNLAFISQSFKGGTEVLRTNVFVLHYWKPEIVSSPMPVFVVPPHAGRHGNIAQRMIDTCVREGRNTFAIELLSATYETKDTPVNDLVMNLHKCQDTIDWLLNTKQVDLVCLCQGAWLGAIYTAKFQERVNRYANFAGPINTHTGMENAIERYCASINLPWHRMIVDMHGGIQPGYMQWLAFSMVDPTYVYFTRWIEYGKAIWSGDEKLINKHRNNNAWYDYPQDLAGNWFLDCLENHFTLNKLYNGCWDVGGEYVDLANITCPIYLYAGSEDNITHPEQVFSMSEAVRSIVIYLTEFPGAGHTKVFVGTEELKMFVQQFLK